MMLNKPYKFRLLLLLTLALPYTLHGQFLDYVSLGYNTVETVDSKNRSSFEYYFTKDPRFSKMAYGRRGYDILQRDNDDLFTQARDGSFYEGDIHHEYKMVDGKLVSFKIGFDADYGEFGVFYKESKSSAKKIEHTGAGITVHFQEGKDKWSVKFYNIPEDKLYEKFMSELVYDFNTTIDYNNQYGNQFDKVKTYTDYELEIFKYCIFAKYNYVFKQEFWKDFMKKYFSSRYLYYASTGPVSYMLFAREEVKILQMIQSRNGEANPTRYVDPPEGLILRDFPDRSGSKKVTIPKGSPVEIITAAPDRVVIDDIEGYWYYVKYNNYEGWVFGGYLASIGKRMN